MSLSNNLNRSPKPQDHVWYFAYGSNLSSEIFRAHRGIQPLEAIPVRLPGWSLTFDIYGVPYQEPAFLSISVAVASTGKNSNGVALPDVHGTAYLVDRKAYYSIIASEGGGTAYEEIAVRAERISSGAEKESHIPQSLVVMTLTRGYAETIPRCPSQRYKDIVVQGAEEAHLPASYRSFLDTIPTYRPPKSAWRLVGAKIFLAIWVPVMMVAEWITNMTANSDGKGNCPRWVHGLVRFLLVAMWLHHDLVHARIFGRGDGLDESGDVETAGENHGRIFLR
ncbi:uncharacterized protein TRIVIDRAFT_170504 [Trichoderma virens Gv29-8]|uniref:gamma-glutamylcyclotransferase n=1 Tax=Hypocrea virens (strain Gv29-8 / FGSC 10586) TaxID=413071 RepID=G9MUC1_HYPVG|nr:uncharacterized protein TRIVIDRAFT_170504 [Trichoderma virens Gv29-8]EHK21971.1 hypothetical protein TRIVIDRAFT_170504 [Trichoderma virens Gv29-8]